MASLRPRRLSFERRIFLLAAGAGLPAIVCALILLWLGEFSNSTRWTLAIALVGLWFGFAVAVRERIAYAMRTLANLLGALREGDFSFRFRMDDGGSLGEVYSQINEMAETLHEQRLGAMEATALLQKVISEFDVAIFAFDAMGLLRLINKSGEALVRLDAAQAMGESAHHLGLAPYLEGPTATVTRATIAGVTGQWSVRRGDFRESGQPHQLLVLTDITRPLREEELHAWQRLVRVLGHEINNSLTPVRALSSSLPADTGGTYPLPEDWLEDIRSGLNVIANRCEALNRFTGAYARLARLPVPKMQPVEVRDWILRVVRPEQRLSVTVSEGPEITIQADPDQLEQMLINLLRNAVDASLERQCGVHLAWHLEQSGLEVLI